MEGVEASAVNLLKRAVELDSGGQRLEEAVTCYQEGCGLLMSVMKGTVFHAKEPRHGWEGGGEDAGCREVEVSVKSLANGCKHKQVRKRFLIEGTKQELSLWTLDQ